MQMLNEKNWKFSGITLNKKNVFCLSPIKNVTWFFHSITED